MLNLSRRDNYLDNYLSQELAYNPTNQQDVWKARHFLGVSVKEVTCKFCKKELDEDKCELDHGCLDCAGYVYIIDGKEECVHCLKNKIVTLQRSYDNASRHRQHYVERVCKLVHGV